MYEGTYLCNIRSLFYLMYSARGNRRLSPCDNFFPKARRKRKREGRMRSSACALTSYRVLWAYALDSRQAKSTASSMDAIRFPVADEFTISSAKLRRRTLTMQCLKSLLVSSKIVCSREKFACLSVE